MIKKTSYKFFIEETEIKNSSIRPTKKSILFILAIQMPQVVFYEQLLFPQCFISCIVHETSFRETHFQLLLKDGSFVLISYIKHRPNSIRGEKKYWDFWKVSADFPDCFETSTVKTNLAFICVTVVIIPQTTVV
jgi:hypothetical protein